MISAEKKAIIEAGINQIFKGVVLSPYEQMTDEELDKILIALDLLRDAIGVKTTHELKYGYKPEFYFTIINR